MRHKLIVVQSSESKPQSRLDRFEQWARIAAAFTIPVLVAGIGAWIQSTIAARTANTEFAKLAVSILLSGDKRSADFRPWAVELLAANSPGGLDDTFKKRLQTGELSFEGLSGLDEEVQKVQLLRDSVYRAVEAYRSGAMNEEALKQALDRVFQSGKGMLMIHEGDFGSGEKAPPPPH